MPEITPAVAAPMPAVPGPVAGVAPAPPAANGATSASDFMGQLTAALKGLKGLAAVVKGLPVTPAPTSDTTAAPAASAPDDGLQPAQTGPQTPSDDVTELLATLGLVLVPTPQSAPLATDVPSGGDTKPAPAPVAAAPAQLQAAGPQIAAAQPVPTDPDQLATANEPLLKTAQAVSADAGKHAAAQPQSAQPAEVPAAPVEAQPAPQQAAPAAQQLAPAPQAPTAPLVTTIQPQLQNVASGGSLQQGTQDGDARHHDASKSAPIGAPASDRAEPVPASVYAAVADAAAATPATPNAAPANAQATDVAAQIAQQVDFYRLPGNKGVRIQLHPEDLGGVQVTVRYAAGGNLELHINVEHAATGNLVQAGLSQLRDALATQGFQPDRMVMSISAPAAAGQMDFNGSNSNNGSYRSDAGLTAFTQDQSGHQQGSGGDDPRGPRGWSATAGESGSASDDSQRAGTSAPAATSRIDYRV
ncbi:MAG: flagellar hook-length control protein FliK [Chloroflexi bacterium]|nr:flagellar hook-length control protein FliK [Chloroflexota bacterium]